MANPATTVSSTDEFLKGLWRENPVFVQVLGMCPVLAVTNTAMNGLAMGLATTAVLVVTCPCALGLAMPLAFDLALARLRRAGVFVREGNLLDTPGGVI